MALVMMSSQFTRFSLDNYRQIDLRILGFLHVFIGLIGIYCVFSQHGGVVLKTLYILLIAFSLEIALFYAFATYRVGRF